MERNRFFLRALLGVGIFLFSTVGFARIAFASHSADLSGDGQVNQADLDILRAQWGGSGSADLNHDGTVTLADAGILFSSWGVLPAPPSPPPPAPPPPPPSPGPGGCPWTQASCWPNNAVPNRNTDATIPAGTTIEVNTTSAEARTLMVHGTLRASRATNSTLTMYGNLIAMDNGIVDYGRNNDRVTAQARIRFVLNEAEYVGGFTNEPLATDVGFWFMDASQLYAHGTYRDTWSSLTQTVSAGATEIRVDPAYAQGWSVGDALVFGSTNRITENSQVERRTITAVLGAGHFRINQGLQFAHEVLSSGWTDSWGDGWTEVMAGKVANLTSNIVFEAADLNHRPHTTFMDQSKAFVEDLAVVGFSPAPQFVGYNEPYDLILPMGRYAWHHHIQDDGSRGSYLRRMRIFDGMGNGLDIHESWGITVEDLVVFNQARFDGREQGFRITANIPIFLERSVESRFPDDSDQGHAADDCWIDRALVIGGGYVNDRPHGHGAWLASSRNCVLGGFTAAGGSLSSGIFWSEGAGQGQMPNVYKTESMSNARGYFSWHNYTEPIPNPHRIVDLLAWRNDLGLQFGAYVTAYWPHKLRSIRNGVGIQHHAANWGVTDFFVDDADIGIQISSYRHASTTDSVYEDGVLRNIRQQNWQHEQTEDVGARSLVVFNRISWVTNVLARFNGGGTPPNNSYIRMRGQTGLPRAANFTLYRTGDPAAPGGTVQDSALNALRVDNDTAGTRPQAPRVRFVSPTPADDSVATGSITLTVETNASSVEFYTGNRVMATVTPTNGRASFTCNMATSCWVGRSPQRRAYFWVEAEGSSGAVNTSRVLRVRRY